MNAIINDIEEISAKMNDIASQFDLKTNPQMNLLYWKWHETRRGMIRACAHLGIRVEAIDSESLHWRISLIGE